MRLGDTRVVEGRTIDGEGGGRARARGQREEERKRDREHNVSHSARSCIFYDMASNLTSRARHNSRPCSPCVLRAPLPPPLRPFLPIAVAKIVRAGVCAERARAGGIALRTRACGCMCVRVHTHVFHGTGTRASERIETIRVVDSS